MSRADLMQLLPDFAEAPPRRPPRAPGFEPLVRDALEKEDFAPLGITSGFIGLAPEPESTVEPFPTLEEFGEAENGYHESDGLNLADIGVDLDDLAGDSTEAEPDGLLGELSDRDLAGDKTGVDAGESDLAADGVIAHEMLEAAHREEMERLEAAHRDALGELVNSAVPGMKAAIVTEIAGQVAPILSRFVRKAAVDSALEALRGELTTLLDDSEVVEFELRGPEALVAAFMQDWPSEGAQVRVTSDDGVDLIARIGKRILSTRLSELDRLLEEAVS